MNLSIEEKVQKIIEDTEECVGESFAEEIKKLITDGELKVYIGTATTGCPHLAYLVPLLKIKDFLHIGASVKILIADLHGMLDANKSPLHLLEARSAFYRKLIAKVLTKLGISTERLEFVLGSSFQTTPEYSFDLLKLAAVTSVHQATRAGAEVVKQQKNPALGSLLYPLMQTLDEEHLGVHLQLGGLDQRKIFMFARDGLPKLGYKKRLHLMTPILPALQTTSNDKKMSASNPNSKIDFFDQKRAISAKLKKATAVPGDVEQSPFLMLFKHVVFRMEPTVVVKREEKFGGNVVFQSYEELEAAYTSSKVHPLDLKNFLAEWIDTFVDELRSSILEGELKENFIKGYEDKAKEIGLI